jgi:hypothetical protein
MYSTHNIKSQTAHESEERVNPKTLIFQAKKWILYFSCLIFSIGVLSRDIRLQTLLINDIGNSEFKSSNLLCGELTRCTRIGGEILGLGSQNFFYLFAQIFNGNPLWQNFYLTDKQYFSIFNGFSSISFRVICLIPIGWYLNKLFKESVNAKIFSVLAITSILSGFPLYYLNNLFGIYLVNYDYMIIFVMGLFINFSNQILKSKIMLFLFTILCTITIENLPLVLFISIWFLNKKTFNRFKLLLLSSLTIFVTYSILLLGVILRNGSIKDMQSDGRYFSFNLQRLPEIIGAIFIIIIWSFVLGVLVGYSGYKGFPTNSLKSALEFIPARNIRGIIIGYFISSFVGIFISILTEFARQLLVLQIMIFVFGVAAGIKYLIGLETRK